MKIVAVDPGIRVMGVAFGERNGPLEWAALVTNPDKTGRRGSTISAMAWELARLLEGRTWGASVVEWPKQYDGAGSFADRRDISELSAMAGAVGVILASRKPEIELTPEPFEWKGQTPKDVHNRRVMAALSPEEQGRIVWPIKSLAHNVIDAVGLLKWAGAEIAKLERQAARPRG